MDDLNMVLLLIAALQIKHLFADFFLQNAKMIMGREKYWHMGRAQHAGIHAVFSIGVLAVFGTPLGALSAIVIAEFVIHFHIDWLKARYSVNRNLQPDQPLYWYAMGTDQAAHQLTYLVMVWVWLCL
ncbi:uncharacterized protein DUF3307 [Shimia isoporae]|uniref:Uncharacterized protein DUF3307 n=1 Tax=Shimia isoporae TaxID=647720 RepID=A0A4R1N7G9_9RHOB|nr:DUF3307 domain-containing protein [Shimia isoporae]TCK99009.1 uncharacterized protein DUF3307 [Shimia isoporae]